MSGFLSQIVPFFQECVCVPSYELKKGESCLVPFKLFNNRRLLTHDQFVVRMLVSLWYQTQRNREIASDTLSLWHSDLPSLDLGGIAFI